MTTREEYLINLLEESNICNDALTKFVDIFSNIEKRFIIIYQNYQTN